MLLSVKKGRINQLFTLKHDLDYARTKRVTAWHPTTKVPIFAGSWLIKYSFTLPNVPIINFLNHFMFLSFI